MNKRAFFVFEPLIVLVFISMLAIAAFIVLDAKTDAIRAPLGRHAAMLARTYVDAENTVFLPRELQARYAIENAVYSIAAGGGIIGNSYCQREGMPAPAESAPVPSYTLASWPTLVSNFGKQVTADLKAPVPYEIVVDAPLRVSGIPLKPEEIFIPDPIPDDEAKKYVAAPPLPNSVYAPRIAFTAVYTYRMKETYDAIRQAVFSLDDLSDLGNCRRFPTGEVKTACLQDKVNRLGTKGLVRFALDSKDAATDTYILTAFHEFTMPLCKNQPTTRVKLVLPTQ